MATRNILFICWSDRPIHGTLIQAAWEAVKMLGWTCSYAGSKAGAPAPALEVGESILITTPFRLLLNLANPNRAPIDAVFLQSVHPANVLIGLWARLNRVPVIYYLHEPSNLSEKLSKGDSPHYATLVALTQQLETRIADIILVAVDALVDHATRHFPHARGSVFVMPLAIPSLPKGHGTPRSESRHRVLYLGRADSARCLTQFSALAIEMAASTPDIRATMLTYSTLDPPLPGVETRSGKSYSDDEMLELLDESIVIWNVYGKPYAQSGVTPVALRSGVPLLVSEHEKEKQLLTEGTAIEVPIHGFDPKNLMEQIIQIKNDSNNISNQCLRLFEKQYSPRAVVSHLLKIPIFRPTRALSVHGDQ